MLITYFWNGCTHTGLARSLPVVSPIHCGVDRNKESNFKNAFILQRLLQPLILSRSPYHHQSTIVKERQIKNEPRTNWSEQFNKKMFCKHLTGALPSHASPRHYIEGKSENNVDDDAPEIRRITGRPTNHEIVPQMYFGSEEETNGIRSVRPINHPKRALVHI